ncbi:GGDEF domain-containing protein [Cellulomonas sp. KRMCY2]|uniref:GGDEF domain-containing protein n=1 Tax=Cellulomonas sp. KRMCY2 TaxID=1304865 RepID=UPI00045E7BAD|nr:GGDEF domain-containing protein [Cellulomonas sp. KRMCY2]
MTRWARQGANSALLCAVLILVPAHLLTDGLTRDLVSSVAAVLPIVVLCTALARHRLGNPHPWRFVLAGLLILWVYSVQWMIMVHGLGRPPTGPIIAFAMPTGYLLFLIGAVMLAYRPSRRNVGVTVDSTIFTMSAAFLLWAMLLGPYLERLALPTATRMRTMAAVVLLSATAGALSSVLSAARARNPSLEYLLVAVASSIVGSVARELTSSPSHPEGAWWVAPFWIIAFCGVGAAALHPSAATLVATTAGPSNRITPVKLVCLGTALGIGPVIALTQHLVGVPVDGVLVGVGSLVLIPLVLARISQLARLYAAAEQRLEHLAGHDELTGLPNRRTLDAHVADALERMNRGETAGVVAIFCDLDCFKEINDAYGHHTGDELLADVARRLRSSVRPGDLVARFGGDEFVLVVEGDPAVTGPAAALRIEQALAEPVRFGDVSVPVRMSIGVAAAHPGDRISADQLLTAADTTMYSDKRQRTPTR